LTELKVGGSRRSIIIPEGKEKNGCGALGLELRKMLYPFHFAVGGTGHPKFIPQIHRHNLEVQNYRTLAKAVQGYHGKVGYHDEHSTSISAYGVQRVKVRVQVSKRELHTHIT